MMRRVAQSRKWPALLVPSVPSRPLRYSHYPTADSGRCGNSSATPGPACRPADSSDRGFRGRGRQPPPCYSISSCCRTGRGTYRPDWPESSGWPSRPRRSAESRRPGRGRDSPDAAHRVGVPQSIRQGELGPVVPYHSFSSPPERSPSIQSRHHEPSVENLLFVTEERWLSPDSVRSLYHVAGGKSSTIRSLQGPARRLGLGGHGARRGKDTGGAGRSRRRAVSPPYRTCCLSQTGRTFAQPAETDCQLRLMQRS
jgi:hypothetical protein